ncbi:hypothetical protein EV649_5087 [Kribbella sp. VKM Ac-2569]|uniref:hypothetical protein n=1 Tax=Kribbella sp. VKM Ac-2569 TaxID=2512220 RepID=UPI00102BD8F7|nr:hypothetical protein [Kribbella sp. VKM Ac-2569]RZT17540.1 hypothetical protein EV649_5087 [Kribbella sp. VKM Ac-2569]
MNDPPARFGVCTLRVEVQPEHLLITITTSRYLSPGARRGVTAAPHTYASVRDALEVTQQFLESFGTWQDTGVNRR